MLILLALGLATMLAGPPDLAERLAAAGRLEQAGDTAAALRAYRSLLSLASPGDPTRATILESLALLETSLGQYTSATGHADEAAAIYAARGDHRRRAVALNRSGLASLYAGDYQVAARTLNTAIALSTSAGYDEGRAQQVTNLGNVYYFLGRYADAARAYETALRVTDAHHDKSWAVRRRRIVQVNKAALYQRLGRDEQALALYRELESEDASLRPREQAETLINLGVIYRRLGDPIKALASYDKALELFSRDRHLDAELSVINNRGIALALDLGELDAARESFSDALVKAREAGNRREILHAQLYRAETQLRAGRAEAARPDFDASLETARALQMPEEEWKALYGLGRVELGLGRRDVAVANLERAVGVIEGIREAIRVPTLRSDFFKDKRDVYDALTGIMLDSAAPDRLFNLIERGHSRAWRERLGLSATLDLAAVQRALRPGVLLLDFWSSGSGSALIAVTRDRAEVRRIDVDTAAIQRLLDTVSGGRSDAWRAIAAKIAAAVLPAALPPGIRYVIVVPDGELALVPFEVLPVGGRLLIEQAAVTYVPTAAMLLRAAPARAGLSPPWAVELRAFADPVFASAELDDAARLRLRLSSAAEEVRAIASELAGASVLHVGRDDRKAYLYDPKASAPILHVATHAIADLDAMEQSRMLFSPAQESATSADYLFLKEAYELPLDGLELAVLSACDTERGRLLRGEGVQSFSRAFLAAGARSTVTTLWRVADRPTAEFMKVFYHHLQRGEPRAEALRRAKLRFVQSGSTLSDPHYWAAFVLTGEGMQPVPRALPWSAVIVVALALVTIAGGIWRTSGFRGRRRFRLTPTVA